MGKKIDLTGKKFNRLTVVRKTGKTKRGMALWECLCDCGNITIVSGGNLKTGGTKSCGCQKSESASKHENLTGKKFGRLIVKRETGRRLKGQIEWECLCDCGNIVFSNKNRLKSGCTKSCGCLRDDLLSDLRRIDISGEKYGKLTAIRPTKKRSSKSIVWECLCDCGNTTFVSASSLRFGITKSCGCLRSDRALSDGNLKKLSRASLASNSHIKFEDVPECMVDINFLRMKINRELRRLNEQR